MNLNEQFLTQKMKLEFGYPHRKFVKMPFEILDYEHPIYFDGRRRGHVDFVVKYERKKYFLEIKGGKGTWAFWNAMKVMAYTTIASYSERKRYHPAILLPIKNINVDILKMARMLNTIIFSYFYDAGRDKITIRAERC